MNKKELIEQIMTKKPYRVRRSELEKIVEATIDTVKNALAVGDKVSLKGFGTFEISERSARTGRNPQTGEAMQIPAAKVVKFSPGKKLKEAVK